MSKYTILFVLLFFCSNYLWGQFNQEKVFYEVGHKLEKYTEKEGVMKPEIAGILEDSKGFLWFANVDYLLKYDGYEFKKYKLRKDQLLAGQPNYFYLLAEDKEGYIWTATSTGLLRFNPITTSFKRVKNANDSVPNLLTTNRFITSLVADKAGEIWVGSYNCLLYTSPSPRDRTRSRMPSSA